MDKYHLDQNQTVYVGDEVRDIEAARRAEIQVIGVTWGFNTRAVLKKNSPDTIVDNPADLLATVKQLLFSLSENANTL